MRELYRAGAGPATPKGPKSLVNGSGAHSLVGASGGSGAEEVLVTVQSDAVVAVNAETQSRKASWRLGSTAFSFAAPCVWDPQSQRYFALLHRSSATSAAAAPAASPTQGKANGTPQANHGELLLVHWEAEGAPPPASFSIAGRVHDGAGCAAGVPVDAGQRMHLLPLSETAGALADSADHTAIKAWPGAREGEAGVAVISEAGNVLVFSRDLELRQHLVLADALGMGSPAGTTDQLTVTAVSTGGSTGAPSVAMAVQITPSVKGAKTPLSTPTTKADPAGPTSALAVVLLHMDTAGSEQKEQDDTMGEGPAPTPVVHVSRVFTVRADISNNSADVSSSRVLGLTLGLDGTVSVLWSTGAWCVYPPACQGDQTAFPSSGPATPAQPSLTRTLKCFDFQPTLPQALSPDPVSTQKKSKKKKDEWGALGAEPDMSNSRGSLGPPSVALAPLGMGPYIGIVGPRDAAITLSGGEDDATVPGTPFGRKGSKGLQNKALGGGGFLAVVLDTRYGCAHACLEVKGEEGPLPMPRGMLGEEPVGRGPVDVRWAGPADSIDGSLVVTVGAACFAADVSLPELNLASMLGALQPSRRFTEASQLGGSAGPAAVVFRSAAVGPVRASVLVPEWHSESRSSQGQSQSAQGQTERGSSRVEASIVPSAGDTLPAARRAAAVKLLDSTGAVTSAELVEGILGLPDLCSAQLRLGEPSGLVAADSTQGQGSGGGGKSKGPKGAVAQDTLAEVRAAVAALPPSAVILCARHALQLQSWEVLTALLQSGQVSGTAMPALIPSLVEAAQLDVLDVAIRHATDVSSGDVQGILVFLLGPKSPAASPANPVAKSRKAAATSALARLEGGQKVVNKKGDSKPRPRGLGREATKKVLAASGFSNAELSVHTLLCRPIDEEVLTSAISSLPSEVVSALLKYVTKWMVLLSAHPTLDYGKGLRARDGGLSLRDAASCPSLAVVIGWMSAILDVHLTQLMLLPEAWDDVILAQRVLNESVATADGLKSLYGMLSHLCSGLPLPAGAAGAPSADYTVEYISLAT